MNSFFYKFLITFIGEVKKNKKKIVIQNSKSIYNFCFLLYKEGYISSIMFFKKKLIVQLTGLDYLKFQEKKVNYYYFNNFFLDNGIYRLRSKIPLLQIKINSTPSKKLYYDLKNIKKYKHLTSTKIYSTSYGFLTCSQCIKKKTGGILICTLH